MKRHIIVTTLLVMTWVAAQAQAQQQPGITVTEVNLASTPEGPRLEMNVAISPGAVTNLQGIAVVPSLTDAAGHNAVFPAVLVNGRNRGLIYQRHEKFGYTEIVDNPPYIEMTIDEKHPGGRVAYSAPIAGQGWMESASLNLAFVLVSPAGERHSYSTAVTGTSVVTIPEAAVVTTPPTVVDSPPVAYIPPVVVAPPVVTPPPPVVQAPPVVETPPAPAAPLQTVSGVANLDFAAGSSTLSYTLGRNARELAAVDDLIAGIVAQPGAQIVSITVTGYSSPEGRYDANSTVAWDRATAFSHYLQQRHGIDSGAIRTRAVGEDWSGLRNAVVERRSTWPAGVLEIIDSPDAPDAKESRLRRMSGGQVWRRMDAEIFPALRKVAYSISYTSL